LFLVRRFKNGKELKAGKHYKMSYEGDEASLTLVSTEANDQGSYLCKVSNKLGTVDTECTLTIQGEIKIPRRVVFFILLIIIGLFWLPVMGEALRAFIGGMFLNGMVTLGRNLGRRSRSC